MVLYMMRDIQSTSVPAEKVNVPPSTASGIVVDGTVSSGKNRRGSARTAVTVGLYRRAAAVAFGTVICSVSVYVTFSAGDGSDQSTPALSGRSTCSPRPQDLRWAG